MTGYACPMHPDQTSASPGRCPLCTMRLVPTGGHACCAAPTPENH